jgi:hypothetical protein
MVPKCKGFVLRSQRTWGVAYRAGKRDTPSASSLSSQDFRFVAICVRKFRRSALAPPVAFGLNITGIVGRVTLWQSRAARNQEVTGTARYRARPNPTLKPTELPKLFRKGSPSPNHFSCCPLNFLCRIVVPLLSFAATCLR